MSTPSDAGLNGQRIRGPEVSTSQGRKVWLSAAFLKRHFCNGQPNPEVNEEREPEKSLTGLRKIIPENHHVSSLLLKIYPEANFSVARV